MASIDLNDGCISLSSTFRVPDFIRFYSTLFVSLFRFLLSTWRLPIFSSSFQCGDNLFESLNLVLYYSVLLHFTLQRIWNTW